MKTHYRNSIEIRHLDSGICMWTDERRKGMIEGEGGMDKVAKIKAIEIWRKAKIAHILANVRCTDKKTGAYRVCVCIMKHSSKLKHAKARHSTDDDDDDVCTHVCVCERAN